LLSANSLLWRTLLLPTGACLKHSSIAWLSQAGSRAGSPAGYEASFPAGYLAGFKVGFQASSQEPVGSPAD